jgi:hypothetical protein
MKELTHKDKKLIHISKGPQFKTKTGPYMAIVFLAFLMFVLFSLLNSYFLLASFFILCCIIFFSLILDIRGIQLNTELHRIREYRAFLWFKTGKWLNTYDFKTIHLIHEKVVTRTSKYSEHPFNTYHYYQIKLVDEIHAKKIFLAEYKNYYKAQHISKYVAKTAGLAFKDFVKGNMPLRSLSDVE